MDGSIFDKVEGWFLKPIREDLSPLGLVALVVLVVIVAAWSHDGIRIIQKGLST